MQAFYQAIVDLCPLHSLEAKSGTSGLHKFDPCSAPEVCVTLPYERQLKIMLRKTPQTPTCLGPDKSL